MKYLDKNGAELKIGDQILVPEPHDNDTWNHSFGAVIDEFKEDYTVVVDGDGDFWCVDTFRLELLQDEHLTDTQILGLKAIGINNIAKQ